MSNAITELGKIAKNSHYLESLRIEAVKSLTNYVPNPEAVSILSEIARNSKYLEVLRKIAVKGLGGVKAPSKINISVE